MARLQTILRDWPSADRLARAMSVSPSVFPKWLRGEAEPSRERLIALADVAKVSIGWLAKGEGPEPSFAAPASMAGRGRTAATEHGVDPDRFVLLPKHAGAAAAGSGTPAPPRPESEYIAFRHDWIRAVFHIEPDDLILEMAVGESMKPTIQDGDLLPVDSTDCAFTNFGIYVLEVQGERLVKRVQRKLTAALC